MNAHRPSKQSLKSLSKTAQYRRVYREGMGTKGENLKVYFAPNVDGQARLGISVSKSVIRKATERSRFKRIIKGWFRQQKKTCLKNGWFVVVAKKFVATNATGSKLIRRELAKLCLAR